MPTEIHRRFEVGEVVEYGGLRYDVAATDGTHLILTGHGHDHFLRISTLNALSEDVRVVGRIPAADRPQRTLKDVGMERSYAGRIAEIWYDAILLLETGVDYGTGGEVGVVVAAFDPKRPLKKRVKRLRKYLLRRGVTARSTRTIYRKRAAYLRDPSILAVVDHRATPRAKTICGRAAPVVIEAIDAVLDERRDESDITDTHKLGDVRARILAADPSFVLPSESSMRRYLNARKQHRNWAPSTKQRVAGSKDPKGKYGRMAASRPGELVMVDTTQVSCMMLDEDGVPRRYEMSILIDVFSRFILGFVLAKTTTAETIVRLIARASVPPTMLVGDTGVQLMAEVEAISGASDPPLVSPTPRPFVAIETLVIDNGKPYVAALTKRRLQDLGIGLRYSRVYTPEDKAPIERAMKTAEQGVIEYIRGYTGRSAEHRGAAVESAGLLHRTTADVLISTWFETVWAMRKSKALKSPLDPKKKLTPLQALTSASVLGPSLPVPYAGTLYVSLLEKGFRKIGNTGIDHQNMKFDSQELSQLRGVPSGDLAHGGRYVVMWDPDFSAILWVFDPFEQNWVCCTRRDLGDFDRPYVGRTMLVAPGSDLLVVTDADRATRELVSRFDPFLAAPEKPRRTLTPGQPLTPVISPRRPPRAPHASRAVIRLMSDEDLDIGHV
ncbi:DDE-type integrase/transposase/recombinase [Microbacterium oxydans]|uniref:DDE-type integrase/transposase/recombinase n=1 Tax=Microbacterium oxydans TaxID=82380 RepID=UPI000F8F9CFE|nr:DDE-type integrase/transposase/recombinase [Microbacterium oxydans]AZS47977.1 hypothetical protein CVS53_02687 [Microbacterium oxydans]